MSWTASDVPDQQGRTFIITGGNSGIGFEAARVLAGKGARVVLACRDPRKADEAVGRIKAEHQGASVESRQLDLSSLQSIRDFAAISPKEAIDVLINNAGVMALPRRETADGFEMQFGTNHLGHFALTGLLLPRLKDRVVTVSSDLHRRGTMHFDDLDFKQKYDKWGAYGQSKLANLLFAYELDRKLKAAGSRVLSVACHPGFAATNLQAAGAAMEGSALKLGAMKVMSALLAQPGEMGALPTLFAATAALRGGEYVGPDGLMGMRGYPTVAKSTDASHSLEDAQRLWGISEQLTQVKWPGVSKAA